MAEFRESTLVWDYHDQTVELYTTDRRVALKAVARNGDLLRFTDLGAGGGAPGYLLVWKLRDLRSPADCIRKGDPEVAASRLESLMTIQEKEVRAAARQRMIDVVNKRS
jgi:hypothetical protein